MRREDQRRAGRDSTFLVEERPTGSRRRVLLEIVLGIALLLPCAARADGAFVAAESRPFPHRLQAFARVEPEALLPLRAQMPGVVAGLSVLPGDPVQVGQVLARLGGAPVEALLAKRRAALHSARARLEAAQHALAIQRRQEKAHLATRLAVDRDRAALADAEAAMETARSQLQATLQVQAIPSPVAGSVLALQATNGQRVARGEAIATIEPADRLWLHAVYYGADAGAVQVGMEGRFEPASGGPSVAVRVRSVAAALRPDAGRMVGLLPLHASPGWRSGESGTVTLEGASRTLTAVPTRALVLDGGRWWVLVHAVKGDRRQAVVPGPSRGGWTAITKGLQPGTPVVVEDAYLKFHRDLSSRYQPPD